VLQGVVPEVWEIFMGWLWQSLGQCLQKHRGGKSLYVSLVAWNCHTPNYSAAATATNKSNNYSTPRYNRVWLLEICWSDYQGPVWLPEKRVTLKQPSW